VVNNKKIIKVQNMLTKFKKLLISLRSSFKKEDILFYVVIIFITTPFHSTITKIFSPIMRLISEPFQTLIAIEAAINTTRLVCSYNLLTVFSKAKQSFVKLWIYFLILDVLLTIISYYAFRMYPLTGASLGYSATEGYNIILKLCFAFFWGSFSLKSKLLKERLKN